MEKLREKLFILFIIGLNSWHVISQPSNTIIKGSFEGANLQDLNLNLITYDLIRENFNYVARSKVDDNGKFIFKINLTKPIFCKFYSDFFFIMPKDLIEIKAVESSKSPTGYELIVVKAKNSNNYTFYKRFEEECKSPFDEFFKDPNFSWSVFKELCNKYYRQRSTFLNRSIENKELSNDFYSFLKNHIYFQYLSSFFQPSYYKVSYERDSLKTYLLEKGLDSLIRTTTFKDYLSFNQLLKEYFQFLIAPELENSEGKEDGYEKQLNYVINNFKSASREFLVLLIFRKTISLPNEKYKHFNKLIYDYSNLNFRDSSNLAFINVKYKLYKNLTQKLPDSILATKVVQLDGSIIPLKNIITSLRGHNILIDNWASWCGPCLDAIRIGNSISYKSALAKSNIKVIYLSQDGNMSQWKKKNNTLKLPIANSFFLKDTKKVFLRYFNITSIPHYILLGKDGELLSQELPNRNDISEMKKMIEK